ncbi:MAG: hypothetical protein LUG49_02235 [Oscillospiraceae bacterium]|nr:hypothetical protein [Oscillospiraceae bacterium]
MGPRGGMMPPPRRRPMRRGCGGCCMPYVMSVVGAITALTLGTAVGVKSAGKKKEQK